MAATGARACALTTSHPLGSAFTLARCEKFMWTTCSAGVDEAREGVDELPHAVDTQSRLGDGETGVTTVTCGAGISRKTSCPRVTGCVTYFLQGTTGTDRRMRKARFAETFEPMVTLRVVLRYRTVATGTTDRAGLRVSTNNGLGMLGSELVSPAGTAGSFELRFG